MENRLANTNQKLDEFLYQIEKIKEAEKKASKIIEEANATASKIEFEGKEKSTEIIAKNTEKITALKNELIAKAKVETQKEIDAILNDAKKQAEKIRSKKLSEKDILSLLEILS